MKPKTASQRADDQRKAANTIALHPADHFPDAVVEPRSRVSLRSKAANSPGTMKGVGGSDTDPFNMAMIRSVMNASWFTTEEEREKSVVASIAAMKGIAPRDEIEGMLAAQMVAAHQATMECYRRAMIQEQPSQLRDMNLNQANKASRTYATLLEALNRHRGKGQQKVTVEHVHVHEGGQAIVGSVDAGGRAASEKSR